MANRMVLWCFVVPVVFAFPIFASAQVCPGYVATLDLGCPASDVALSAGYAFVACGEDGLVVVDVASSFMPAVVGSGVLSQVTPRRGLPWCRR